MAEEKLMSIEKEKELKVFGATIHGLWVLKIQRGFHQVFYQVENHIVEIYQSLLVREKQVQQQPLVVEM